MIDRIKKIIKYYICRRCFELHLPALRKEFRNVQFSEYAIQKLIDDYSFESVLDVGCGTGEHAELFIEYNKSVTAIDYGNSIYFKKNKSNIDTIIADFNSYNFSKQFDCIWCSHVLEHQLNVKIFLEKINAILREGGVLAVTVPPLKHDVVGGHTSVWNAGLLLYNLILAGFNCKDAAVLKYGYNISVIIKKQPIDIIETLDFDNGDIRKIRPYLPTMLKLKSNKEDDSFNGNIKKLNW